jgi:hypothetical protein
MSVPFDCVVSTVDGCNAAQNHIGVCLGIKVLVDRVLPMNYQPEHVELLLRMSPLEVALDDEVQAVRDDKVQGKGYEREWLYIEKLEHKEEATGFNCVDFPPDIELREIIAGARYERCLADIRRQVFGNTEVITMFRAKAAFGTFSIVRQRAQQTLTISSVHQARGVIRRFRGSNSRDQDWR